MIHGNIEMSNIVRFSRKHLTLVDLKCSYLRRTTNSFEDVQDRSVLYDSFMGGSSRLFSTAILPPEMFYKIVSGATPTKEEEDALERYERYWKLVSDDAKDLKLLTPDDVHTISCVIKSITLNQTTVAETATWPERRNGGKDPGMNGSHLLANINPNASKDWRDTFSTALVTISFDDLPHSLTSCDTFEDFCIGWNRILYNSYIWERIKPRTHMAVDKAVYVIKCFNDMVPKVDETSVASKLTQRAAHPNEIKDSQDLSLLPYQIVRAQEKIDIWMLGTLIFQMCSGEALFLSDMRGNLKDCASWAELEAWDKKSAEKYVMAKVDDPLAQDLLLQILIPEDDRLYNMEMVLNHPFFGPSSSIEAQCILEKHEEQQLMMEETVVIPRSNMTAETLRRLDNATEKQCKIIFEEEKVVIPTCFIVLPYELQYDPKIRRLVVAKNEDHADNVELAVKIGKHLLDINNATARLSFWLMMKKNLSENDGGVFKAKLKDWLKRARSEAGELVAMEIVQHIGCGTEYIDICREMLEKSDSVSNARAYIRDPMGAAKEAMKLSTEAIIKCYWPKKQYFYLVDEFSGCPVASQQKSPQSIPEEPDDDTTYPLQIDANTRLLKKVFLPFMNLTVMAVTANERLISMSKLLGLPASHRTPEVWKAAEPGLIHQIDQPSSVAEFAVLQDMIKKQNEQAKLDRDSTTDTSAASTNMSDDTSAPSNASNAALTEMRQLEIFYREYDPMRMFSDLRRVSDGKTSAIWTSQRQVFKIKEEVEFASMESRLRDLRKEYAKKEKIEQEMEQLESKLSLLRQQKDKLSSSRSVVSVRSTQSNRSNAIAMGDGHLALHRPQPSPSNAYGTVPVNNYYTAEEDDGLRSVDLERHPPPFPTNSRYAQNHIPAYGAASIASGFSRVTSDRSFASTPDPKTENLLGGKKTKTRGKKSKLKFFGR